MSNVQQKIAKTIFEVFNLVEQVTENELALREMILGMGWELEELAGFSLGDLSDALNPMSEELQKLSIFIEKPPKKLNDFKKVLSLSKSLFKHLEDLKKVLENLEFDGIGKERLGEFVEDVLNYVVIILLVVRTPLLYHLSVLLTLIQGEKRLEPILDKDGKLIRHPKVVPVLQLKRFSKLLQDPIKLLREEYFPNRLQTDKDAIIAANKLFPRIANLLKEFDVNTVFGYAPYHEVDFGEVGNKIMAGTLTIFTETGIGNQDLGLALSLSLSPKESGDLGLVITPSGSFNFSHSFNDWQLEMALNASIDALAIGREDITLLADNNTNSFEAKFGMTKLPKEENNPVFLLGSAEATRLEIGSFAWAVLLSYQDDNLLFDIFGQAEKAAIVIAPSDGDGFISSILPSDGINLNFDFGLGWSNQKGLYFKGNASLEAVYTIHKSFLKILEIQQLALKISPKEDSIHLESKLNFTTTLGPVEASVNDIGLNFAFSNFGEGGNIGIADLSFDFLSPKSIGLHIESEVITGGGFLEFDPDNHRYAGVLTLNFLEIELTAIGLINTRLPNNQKGFSMLVSISVLFAPPIQLSFGFTLNGVGGLIGIRRTVKVKELQNRIRKGAITSIMFPKDVIKNAPKIISDLRAIFPPKKGHYVVAPFLRIGWGSPTIVEIDLGVVVEIPFKSRVLLLGSVGLYLPNKTIKKRLVELHIDIFGDFNFAESYVLIEGRLRDSHVVGIPLTGGFAFVLDWGKQPQFLMSVGGYHPRYKKPARFPEIPRLTASIKKGENISLTCQYYQAITSNSFQIGFSANLVVKKGKAKATGFLGFNALLQFDPFLFVIDIHINVSVSYKGKRFLGVELYFELSGPKPWRAKGYAKIDLWLFSLKIRFDYEWGGKQKVQLRTVKTDVLLERLQAQLSEENNWSAKLMSGFSNAAALRKLEEEEQKDRILVHPSGFLELRQNLLPLNKKIDKLGSEYVNKAGYSIVDYQIGEESTVKIDRADLKEYFSRGQFEELSDDKKLSTPDFELMSAGIAVKSKDAYDFAAEFSFTDNGFEDIVLTIEEEDGEKIIIRDDATSNAYNWQGNRQMNLSMNQHQRSLSEAANAFGLLDDLPTYDDKKYEITHKDKLNYPPNLEYPYFDTYSEANEYLQKHLKAEKWQIMEVVEEMV